MRKQRHIANDRYPLYSLLLKNGERFMSAVADNRQKFIFQFNAGTGFLSICPNSNDDEERGYNCRAYHIGFECDKHRQAAILECTKNTSPVPAGLRKRG